MQKKLNSTKLWRKILLVFGFILTILFLLMIIVSIISDGLSNSIGFIIFAVIIDLMVFMTCNILKKHSEKLIIEIDKISQVQQLFKELNTEWNIDEATNVYCMVNNKNKDCLDDNDLQTIWEYARVDIAFLTTWLIDNNFYSTQNNEVKSAIEKVKTRELSGNDFVSSYCDEKLVRNDIANVIVDFFDNYIVNGFEYNYKNFVEQELNKKMYGFSFSWEDYEKFKLMIDNVYNKSFKHNN